MDNTLLKTAVIAVLESMTNEELGMLKDLIIMKSDIATLTREALAFQSTSSHLAERANEIHWTEVYTDTLDALWALHDDPSEKTKVFLSWIAEQQ